MSTTVLPALPGLTYPLTRTMLWSNTTQEALSGKQTRVANWSYPRWEWEISYSVLRTWAGTAEFQQLVNFILERQGSFDTWLYEDTDDNTVTAQPLGLGDGVTTTFQLVRAFGGVGGFVEPIYAPNQVSAVYAAGVAQASNTWSVQGWESAAPGLLTFTAPPAAGAEITADFTFYFPVHFKDDTAALQKFMDQRYKADKLAFQSIK